MKSDFGTREYNKVNNWKVKVFEIKRLNTYYVLKGSFGAKKNAVTGKYEGGIYVDVMIPIKEFYLSESGSNEMYLVSGRISFDTTIGKNGKSYNNNIIWADRITKYEYKKSYAR